MNIKIIYQDNDVIVIEKDAGILVHPLTMLGASPAERNTLIDILKIKYPNAELVHRLDQNTSGLMVVAKNHQTAEFLKEQFKNRTIKKKYLALVYGILKDKKGIIAKSISKSRKRGGSQTTTPIGKMREAVTRYEVIKEYSPNSDSVGTGDKDYSLVEVSPETGRTHQIRVHLASIGHPIAGDEKYKFKRQEKIEGLNRPRNAPAGQRGRHFLHAKYLKFQLPNGEIKEFESKLPNELSKILEKL